MSYNTKIAGVPATVRHNTRPEETVLSFKNSDDMHKVERSLKEAGIAYTVKTWKGQRLNEIRTPATAEEIKAI